MIRGWVYIITNQSMPQLVKFGYSTKDPLLRAKELNNTGVPHPYKVAYDVLVMNPKNNEAVIHKKYQNLKEGKEWFKVEVVDSINMVRDTLKSEILLEHVHINLSDYQDEAFDECKATNEAFDESITKTQTCNFSNCEDEVIKEFEGKEYCIWHYRKLKNPSKSESILLLREEFKATQKQI